MWHIIKKYMIFVRAYFLLKVKDIKMLLPLKFKLLLKIELGYNEKHKIMRNVFRRKAFLPLFSNKRVLCWEPCSWLVQIDLIASIGAALSLRGSTVEQVICDGVPIACAGREITDGETYMDWGGKCANCFKASKKEVEAFNLKVVAIKEILDDGILQKIKDISEEIEPDKIPSFIYRGIGVGKYAVSSLMRYCKGASFDSSAEILRAYFYAALVITEAAFRKIESFKPDILYMTHGIYVTWGPAWEIAIKKNIPVVKIGGGFSKGHIYFRRIDNLSNVHLGVLSNQKWQSICKQPMTQAENEKLDNFLLERYKFEGSTFCDVKINAEVEKREVVCRKLGITPDKPIWCIFSHVAWDDSLNMSKMAFLNYVVWIEETLKLIKNVHDVNWIIKIHPSEAWNKTAVGVGKTIERIFLVLPDNIKLIKPEDRMNTLSVFNAITGGVTCRGTIGLELAALGKPVVLAADAYYSGKGFTYDGLNADNYKKLLLNIDKIPPTLSAEQKEKARKFAHMYFLKRQMPLGMFKRGSHFVSFDWAKSDFLLPGGDPVIDVICEKFFAGEDFIVPDEVIPDLHS